MLQDDELSHHGILGQKWGVRRFQNADGSLTQAGKERYGITNYSVNGGVIKKGSNLYRISIDSSDKTYDNKKYVSTNKYDNSLWKDYLANRYKSRGYDVYGVQYKTLDDIKVASQTELGKSFCKYLISDPNYTVNQTTNAYRTLGLSIPENIGYASAASVNMAAQTKLGKQIVNDLLTNGYGATVDVHGQNVANDPIVILNPDKKLKKIKQNKIK